MYGHDPFHRSRDQLQLPIQLHSWWLEWIASIISHNRAHRQAIVRYDLGFFVGGLFRLPLDFSNPAPPLFQLFLEMAVPVADRLRHIFQIVILANLMWHAG
jgi:hypothetical protein